LITCVTPNDPTSLSMLPNRPKLLSGNGMKFMAITNYVNFTRSWNNCVSFVVKLVSCGDDVNELKQRPLIDILGRNKRRVVEFVPQMPLLYRGLAGNLW
jgi:hypothetical protein